MQPSVQHFFDPVTSTFSYVVYDPQSCHGVIIDPVLDFDMASGQVSAQSADALLAFVRANGLSIEWILETHAHADHLTAAQYLREQTGAKIAIGNGITKVQSTFKTVYNLGSGFSTDGCQFDQLLDDGQCLQVGALEIRVMATPGHTNDSVTYVIGDAAFIGDTMFHPQVGTARCDFPGGDASMLYSSIQKILSLPKDTRLFLCHDYPGDARDEVCEVSISQQKADNIHVNVRADESQFIQYRKTRDAQLAVPRLLYPAIQVNIAAGQLPEHEDNGVSYLKIPLTQPGENG